MGACLSSDIESPPTAKVVSLKGDLREHKVPVLVSQVLAQTEPDQNDQSSSSNKFFLCNSDGLSYDDYIPALNSEDELEANQIYFILPTSKLQNRLSASDMAALAVKASVALQKKDGRQRRKKARQISPVLTSSSSSGLQYEQKTLGKSSGVGIGMSRSGSVRKLHRYTSRRAKLAVRSFRLKLSTIYEGIVV